jgi:hypothetical protein
MGTFQTAFTFQKGVLTNGAQLPGEDYISGLLFYGTAPSGFPSNYVKQMFSIQDAINVGIKGDSSDETAATGSYAVTHGASGAGDTISIYVQEPINPLNTNTNPDKVLLVSYTTVAGDTTAATLCSNIVTAINANKAANGGYSAAVVTSTTVSITARPGLGVALNSGTPISVVITGGTITGTITQFASGAASKLDVFYYHISEYFRMNPNGNLFVGLFPVPVSYNFNEVQTMQMIAKGAIRQVGVYTQARTLVSNGVTDANSLNTICSTLDTNKMPLSAVLVEDMSAVTDLTTLPNLALLSDEWVSVCIGQDGAAKGWSLYEATGKTIGNLGAIIGTISINQVSACIGQPIPQNNISDGTENELPALGNNTLFQSVATTLQTQLDNYRYIYIGHYVGYNGTYFSDSHCAIISNSNYAYIEENRVFAKLERLLYTAYLPYLKSQLALNADGTLATYLVAALQSVGDNTINTNMVAQGELSQVQTVINPNQNVTTTGKLVVTVNEINNAIARNIEIDINSVQSI